MRGITKTVGVGAGAMIGIWNYDRYSHRCDANFPQLNSKVGKSFSSSFPANNPSEDRILIDEHSKKYKIYGVFDGHGGWQVSDFVVTNLSSILFPKLYNSNSTVEIALKEAFQELEENYIERIRSSYQLGFGEVAKVGCCANVVVLYDDDDNYDGGDDNYYDDGDKNKNKNRNKIVTVANSGDCRTIIGTHLGHPLNPTHSYHDNPVISNVQGQLYTCYHVGRDHNARTSLEQYLLSHEHPNEENIVKCKSSHACYVKGRLQLTRAIGDLYLKSDEFNVPSDTLRFRGRYISPPFTPPYVKTSPEIQSITLDSNDKFIVMASDGVWDFMTPLEVTSFIAKYVDPNQRKDVDVSQLLVEEVLRIAAVEASESSFSLVTSQDLKELPAGRSRRSKYDDTTAIVVFLN